MGPRSSDRVVWKRFDCEQETIIALLNEVLEMHGSVRITLRDSNDPRKIRFDQGLARGFRLFVVGQHVTGARFLRHESTAERSDHA